MSGPFEREARSEVEADLAAGRYTTFENAEEFLAHLNRIVESDEPPHDEDG